MATPMNCAAMLTLVRDLSAEHEPGEVLDGYPADEGYYPPGIRILPHVNEAVKELAETGFRKCRFDHALRASVREYLFTHSLSSVLSATLYDSNASRYLPIEKSSIPDIEADDPTWMNRQASVPTHWYQVGTQSFGLHPLPTTTGLVLTFLGDVAYDDMTTATQYPSQVSDALGNVVQGADGYPETVLPALYHKLPCYKAAAEICLLRGKESLAARNLARWEDGYAKLSAIAEDRLDGGTRHVRISNCGRRRR